MYVCFHIAVNSCHADTPLLRTGAKSLTFLLFYLLQRIPLMYSMTYFAVCRGMYFVDWIFPQLIG